MQKAQHSVIMIGWEFDTRIDPDTRRERAMCRTSWAGSSAGWSTAPRPEALHAPMGGGPRVDARSRLHPAQACRLADRARIRLKLDHAHPSGAAHHQKIIVIDDRFAFCGASMPPPTDGIPPSTRMTAPTGSGRPRTGLRPMARCGARGGWRCGPRRWERLRRRARWKGPRPAETLRSPPPVPRYGPDLHPDLTDGERGDLAHGAAYGGRDAVHEIEALYLSIYRSRATHALH